MTMKVAIVGSRQYTNKRRLLYVNKVKLLSHNLDNFNQKLDRNIFKNLEKNVKKQQKYTKKMFFIEKKYRNLNDAVFREIDGLIKNGFFKKN